MGSPCSIPRAWTRLRWQRNPAGARKTLGVPGLDLLADVASPTCLMSSPTTAHRQVLLTLLENALKFTP